MGSTFAYSDDTQSESVPLETSQKKSFVYSTDTVTLMFRLGMGPTYSTAPIVSHRFGLLAGVGVSKPISRIVGIQGGIYYDQYQMIYQTEEDWFGKLTIHSILIPVVIRLRIPFPNTSPYIGIGGHLNLNLKAIQKQSESYDEPFAKLDYNHSLNVFTAGLYGEIGFEYHSKLGNFGICFQYHYNLLSNLEPFPGTTIDGNLAQLALSLFYGYNFELK